MKEGTLQLYFPYIERYQAPPNVARWHQGLGPHTEMGIVLSVIPFPNRNIKLLYLHYNPMHYIDLIIPVPCLYLPLKVDL